MSAQPVDVLAVMESDAAHAKAMRQRMAADNVEESYMRSAAARAAVAELVEADREYDKAKAAFVASIPFAETGTNMDERERYAKAAARRDAALARIGGAP